MATAIDVINGRARSSVECADCLNWLGSLPDDSVDLVFGSPQYEDVRSYGIGVKLSGQDWVDWMVEVFKASLRVCKGLVAFVVAGKTRKFRWSATPALLMADLHRAGIRLRSPPIYRRFGIMGSGGPDWLRADYEFIVCATKCKKRLPWSNNVACGKPPKYGPGGAPSHRTRDGARVNQRKDRTYVPPKIANPGNVITCAVGGGKMGHQSAHESEAPFSMDLAKFFIWSFCPPDGIVADCFLGSGTTIHTALDNGRRGIGCDIRESQVQLALKRISTVTPPLPGMEP